MRLALLLGAQPLSAGVGPKVRLLKGRYRLEVQGKHESKLALHLDDALVFPDVSDGLEFNITSDVAVAQLLFVERGKEKAVNILAKLMEKSRNGS